MTWPHEGRKKSFMGLTIVCVYDVENFSFSSVALALFSNYSLPIKMELP